MTSNVMDYLYGLTHKNNIGVISTDILSKSTTATSNTEYRSILINANWHNKRQIPFQFAHEIGHILNDDISDKILYFTPFKTKTELSANKYAIDTLLVFYMKDKNENEVNLHRFMEYFAIPYHLEDLVINEFKIYLGR